MWGAPEGLGPIALCIVLRPSVTFRSQCRLLSPVLHYIPAPPQLMGFLTPSPLHSPPQLQGGRAPPSQERSLLEASAALGFHGY